MWKLSINNVIQLIVQKVKNEIEKSIIKVIEGNTNFSDIVDSVKEMVDEIDTIKVIVMKLEGGTEIIDNSKYVLDYYHLSKYIKKAFSF